MEDQGEMSSTTLIKMNDETIRGDSWPILTNSNLSEKDRKGYFIWLFEQYDRDGNGTVDAKELATMLQKEHDISDTVIKKIIDFSDKNGDRKLDLKEFANMVSDKRFKKLFGHYINSYVNFIVPQHKRKFRPVGRSATVRKREEDEFDDGVSCWPPPISMIFVSIFEIICYILNERVPIPENQSIYEGNGVVADILIYNPEKRQQCWRFLTYMFVHIGWSHLTMNLVTQIFLGVSLELRNRWYRVLTVYAAGVLAGSLVTSIMDPTVYLAGASGGVYAIITAHLSNIIMNWNEMATAATQLFIFLLLIFADVATAIHDRYQLGDATPIGYAAHFGGALAGFLVGIWVLKNLESTKNEEYLWWAALVVYILLMGTAIVLNIVWNDHFLPTK